jgi:cysteine-rich repeat protein
MSGRNVMKPATTVVVLLGMWSWTGCGDECSRSSDCPAGHICYQGSCRPIGFDADADGDAEGGPDADADADGDTDIPGPDADADDVPGPDADADADGEDIPGPVCGNDRCEVGEGCAGCPVDCGVCPGCPNGVCEVAVESCIDCEADCGICPPICGDSLCEAGETCSACAYDCRCPDCPDGTCQAYESCSACEADCGACPVECGNGIVQTGEECDDGNTVSGDGCEPGCRFTCHEGDPCDDGDPCTEDFCDSSSHTCGGRPGPDGVTCGGGDICTGMGTCLAGVCVHSSPPDCNDWEDCTTDTCDPVAGCVHTPKAAGTTCNDGFYCLTGERCRLGLDGLMYCTAEFGTSPCDDGNPCTDDACDEATDSCSWTSPTYRPVECGADGRGDTMGMSGRYRNLACPDGTHAAAGPDDMAQVTPTTSGTLTVTVTAAESAPGTTVHILTNPCSTSSCISRGTTTATATVTAGTTYYILVDTGLPADPEHPDGRWVYSVTCP